MSCYVVHSFLLHNLFTITMQTLADVGRLLLEARKARGLSAPQLAAAVGVHRNTIYAAEKGRTSLELSSLLAILDGLGHQLALVPVGAPTGLGGLEGPGTLTPMQERIRALASPASPAEP